MPAPMASDQAESPIPSALDDIWAKFQALAFRFNVSTVVDVVRTELDLRNGFVDRSARRNPESIARVLYSVCRDWDEESLPDDWSPSDLRPICDLMPAATGMAIAELERLSEAEHDEYVCMLCNGFEYRIARVSLMLQNLIASNPNAAPHAVSDIVGGWIGPFSKKQGKIKRSFKEIHKLSVDGYISFAGARGDDGTLFHWSAVCFCPIKKVCWLPPAGHPARTLVEVSDDGDIQVSPGYPAQAFRIIPGVALVDHAGNEIEQLYACVPEARFSADHRLTDNDCASWVLHIAGVDLAEHGTRGRSLEDLAVRGLLREGDYTIRRAMETAPEGAVRKFMQRVSRGMS